MVSIEVVSPQHKLMLTENDIEQIESLGASRQLVEDQLDNFVNGFPYLNVLSPALVSHGITVLGKREQVEQIKRYEGFGGSILKFVPASGAATRMFKDLYRFKESGGTLDLNDKQNKAIKEFFDKLNEFAFYGELNQLMFEKGIDLRQFLSDNYLSAISTLLDKDGMNYGHLPKAVLKFHKYPDQVRTAIEEHLVESALYASGKEKVARLHFTVSADHRKDIEKLLKQIVPLYEERFGFKYQISMSEQKKSTDTIAVDMDNNPFRNADGSLLFRPGGHGALIENLNEQREDIIFIKNVDNVVPETKVNETIYWKKVLAGLLLTNRDKVYAYLSQLERGQKDSDFLSEICDFMQNVFSISLPQSISEDERAELLYSKLHRPIRVCGVVKNEGEPGGGPYIVQESDGTTSLQLLEVQQINMGDARMRKYFDSLTHFNPVDVVCSCYDHKGKKYNLKDFVDPKTGFISEKSVDGKPIKAQELPGLWNGAMSKWNTIFVEVPLSTFNPVKTVNDLLRKEHQVLMV